MCKWPVVVVNGDLWVGNISFLEYYYGTEVKTATSVLVSGQNTQVCWCGQGCLAEEFSHIKLIKSLAHWYAIERSTKKKIKVSPQICVVTVRNLWWIMKKRKKACSDRDSWTHLVSKCLLKPGNSPLWFSLQLARQGVSFRQLNNDKGAGGLIKNQGMLLPPGHNFIL